MPQSPILHTGRASLCALGEYLRRRCFFAPLREQGTMPQKTVRYRPIDTILDALVGILCGAKTMAQSHVTMRTDPAGQRAFGRTGCADQSTIARTLRACTVDTIAQLRDGVKITSRFKVTAGLPSNSILGGPCQRRLACSF